jgi:hypothetical protein
VAITVGIRVHRTVRRLERHTEKQPGRRSVNSWMEMWRASNHGTSEEKNLIVVYRPSKSMQKTFFDSEYEYR